jgi:hypothetical protein
MVGGVMNKYSCTGHRNVSADWMSEAAEIFAGREARRKYGRSGYCRTCTQQAWRQDGGMAEYSAFIGYSTGRNETTGNNINFTVYNERVS